MAEKIYLSCSEINILAILDGDVDLGEIETTDSQGNI